jgi:hypothetical protein
MASPKIEVFFLYDSAGAPLTGATPTFDTYKDDLGANLAQPSITEIGGGAYKFTPVLDPARGIAYVVDGGASSNPRRLARYVRPEDFATDLVQDLWDIEFGKWQIATSGPDIHRLVLYRPDNSILKKFDLFDSAGIPTSINPFRRDPV